MSTKILSLPKYQGIGNAAFMLSPGPEPFDLGQIIGANVERLRAQRGLSVKRLAGLVGVRLYTIQQIEAGKTRKSKYLPDIARILGVSLAEIDPTQATAGAKAMAKALSRRQVIGEYDLPVYGTTEGGLGILVMTAEPVDRADRPPSLQHVKDAYGVIVTGESMVPVLRPGYIVAIHPHIQPRREDLCIFRDLTHGEFKSTIKEFVSQTADSWTVRRYGDNPKEYKLKKADWPVCHVVVTIHRR